MHRGPCSLADWLSHQSSACETHTHTRVWTPAQYLGETEKWLRCTMMQGGLTVPCKGQWSNLSPPPHSGTGRGPPERNGRPSQIQSDPKENRARLVNWNPTFNQYRHLVVRISKCSKFHKSQPFWLRKYEFFFLNKSPQKKKKHTAYVFWVFFPLEMCTMLK